MFDIGFLEILVILIIALLVIGPERMPEVARKLGSFMGKTRRFINQMKEDSPIKDTVQEVQSAMNLEEEKQKINNIGKELEQGLNFNEMELDMDDFKRPFGGDANQASGGSQFNKAPAQPKAPDQDSANTNDTSAPVETAQTSSEPTKTEQASIKSEPEKDTQKS